MSTKTPSRPRVAVVNYGMGNLHSVAKALAHVGAQPFITAKPGDIRAADRVVFPGVGAFGDCMKALHAYRLVDVVAEVAREKPFLGVCLGLQLLLEMGFEHGEHRGLGVLPGQVLPFPAEEMKDTDGRALKIPHMGWNEVQQLQPHPLWADIPQHSRFYFVHSYYAEPSNPEFLAACTHYGITFPSALATGNIFAVQFHPEKSAQAGLTLYRNFVNWHVTDSRN